MICKSSHSTAIWWWRYMSCYLFCKLSSYNTEEKTIIQKVQFLRLDMSENGTTGKVSVLVIHRFCHKTFYFDLEFWFLKAVYKVLNRFYKNASNHQIFWKSARLKIFLPIGWNTFIWWNTPPKCCTCTWSRSNPCIPQTVLFPICFETGLLEKRSVGTHASRPLKNYGIGGFLYLLARKFVLQ